jgi:dihydroneopterin aldolase
LDIIYIRDLRVDAVIGIYEWERRIHQTLRFELELGADVARAAAKDAIEDTVNYKAVAKRVIALAQESRYRLVETLAERIAEVLMDEFGLGWLRLSLGKPLAVRGAQEVGVVIERGRRP